MANISIYKNKTRQRVAGMITQDKLRQQIEQQRNSFLRSFADDMDYYNGNYDKYYIAGTQDAKSGLYPLFYLDEANVLTPVIGQGNQQVMIPDYNNMLKNTGKIGSGQLFRQDQNLWESINSNIVEKAEAEMMRRKNAGVAPIFAAKNIQRVLDSNFKVFFPRKVNEKKLAEFAALGIHAYEGITSGFVMDVLSNNTLHSRISHQYMSTSNAKQSKSSLLFGLANIVKHNGEAVVFDLETSGRADIYGKGIVGPNIIHEFSFSRIQGTFGDDTNLGDIIDFDKNKQDILTNHTENSIIGASEKEYKYYMNLIDLKFNKRAKLSKEQEVTIQRLALTGNETTKLVSENGINGLFQFASFAEMDDLHNGVTKEDALKGANLFKRIGIIQGVFENDESKMVDFMGHKMYAYEASLLRGLMPTMLTNNNQDPLTLLSHNGRVFDNHLIYSYGNSEKASSGFKNLVSSVTGNTQMMIPYQFDDMAMERAYYDDRIGTIKDMIAKVYPDEKEAAEAYSRWETFIRENKKGTFTQESLMHALFQDSLQEAAHVANEDALGDARIIFRMGNDFMDKLSNDPEVLNSRIVSSGQAYYAVSSPGAKSGNMTALMIDQMTGQVRTSDGFAITENGVEQELFDQRGVKKHGLYEVVSVGQLTDDNPLYEKLKVMNPDLGMGGISFVHLRPVVKDAESTEAYSDIIQFGDAERLEGFFDSSMRYAGTVNNGVIDKSDLTQSEKEALSFVSMDENGMHVVDYDNVDIVAESTFAFDNESAARYSREHDIKKDKKLLDWIDEVDRYAQDKIDEMESMGRTPSISEIKQFKKDYETAAKENTLKIYKAMAQGEDVSELMKKPNYIKAFGYEQKYDMRGTNPMYAYSNTINTAINRENFVRKNRGLIEATMSASLYAADEVSVENARDMSALNRQYKLRMQSAIEYAQQKAEENGGNARETAGFKPHGLSVDELRNRFEIDLTGFMGIKENLENPDENIVRLNLRSSGFGLIDPVVKKIKGKNPDDISSNVKSSIAQKLQQFLIDKGLAPIPDENHLILDTDPDDIAYTKLSAHLKAYKEQDLSAGFLKHTDRMDVLDIENFAENYGLTPEEIKEINAESYATFKEIRPSSDHEIDEVARMINDKIITPDIADFDATVQNGYSKEEAGHLINMYETKRKAGLQTARELVKGVMDAGGTLLYDESTNGLFLSDPGEDGKITQMFLPSQRYDAGNMYAEIGANRTRKLDSSGFYTVEKWANGSKEQDLIFGSILDVVNSRLKAKTVTEYLKRGMENNGTMTEEMDYIINSFINKHYRDNITELMKNAGDSRLGSFVRFNDVTENLSLLKDTKAMLELRSDTFEDIVDEGMRNTKIAFRDKLFTLMDNGAKFSELGADLSVVFGHFIPYIQDALKEKLGDNADVADIIDSLNFSTKQYGKGYASISKAQTVGGNTHQIQKRGIEDAKLNAPVFDDAPRIRDEYVLSASGHEISFGAPMMTEFEKSQLSRYDTKKYTSLTLSGMNISSPDLNLVIQEGLKNSNFSSGTKAALTSMNTTDAAGIMSPIAADMAFNIRTYEQRVLVSKLEDNANEAVQEMLQKKVMSDITIDEYGNVKFSYKDGEFVYASDSLFGRKRKKQPEIMLKGYGDSPEPLKIKESGFLQHRYYNGSNVVSEEHINKILNTTENLERIMAGETPEEQIRIAHDILSETKLDSKLRIKTALDPLAVKVVTESEKNEAAVLVTGLGAENEQVKNFIKILSNKAGYKGEDNAFTKRVIGEVFNADILDTIAQTDGQSLFAKVMDSFSNKGQITQKHINEAITEAGFSDNMDFLSKVYEERRTYWDAFEQIMENAGILVKKDLEGNIINGAKQHVDMVVNNIAGQAKHMDISPLNQLVSEMQEDYKREGKFNTVDEKKKANKEIVQKLAEENIYKGLSVDEEGNLINHGDADINIKNLVNFAEEAGYNKRSERSVHLDAGIKDADSPKINAMINQMTVMQLPNYDVSKHDTLSFDERVMTNLDASRLDNYTRRTIEETLSNTVGLFDKKMEADIKNILAGNIYDGKTMYREYMANIKKNQSFTEGEELVYSNYKGSEVNLSKEDIEKTVESGKGNRGIRRLADKGMSANDIYNTIEAMKENGADKISYDRVLDMYSLSSAVTANNFNNGNGRVTLENLKQNGYSVVNIDDLDTDAMSRGRNGSLMDNKLIIDLKSAKGLPGGISLYTDETDRYIALPFTPTSKMDEAGNEIKSDIQSSVARAYKRIEKYSQEYPELSDAQVSARIDGINEALQSVRENINKFATSNKGIGKIAYRSEGQSISKKAHAHKFFGTENDGYLSEFNFEGINLKDFARYTESALMYNMGQAINQGKDLGETMQILEKSKAAIPYTILGKEDMVKSYAGTIKELERHDKKTARALSNALFDFYDEGNSTVAAARRYPVNYQGSESATALFFSTKGGVGQGDVSYVNEDFWNAVHGDSDSDSKNTLLIKSRATVSITNKNGKVNTFEMDIDDATYKVLNKMDNVNVTMNDDGALFNEAKRNVFNTAFTVASRYYGDAEGSDFKKAYQDYEGILSQIRTNHNLDADYEFSSKDINEMLTNEERNQLRASFDIMKEKGSIFTGKLRDRTYDGENIAPSKVYSLEESKKYESLYSQIRSDVREKIGEEAFDGMESVEQKIAMRQYAGDNADAIEALRYNAIRDEMLNSISAVSGKKSAGALDVSMYSFFRMAEQSGRFSEPEIRALQMIRVAAQEGTTLTAKSESAGADPEKIQKVQNAMRDMMDFTTGARREGWEKEAPRIRAVLQDALSERSGKELAKLADQFSTYESGEKRGDMDKIMDFFMSVPERISGNSGTKSSLKTFDSQSGAPMGKMATVSNYDNSLIGQVSQVVNSISEREGNGEAIKIVSAPTSNVSADVMSNPADVDESDIATGGKTMDRAFERLVDRSRQLGSRGGLGAIGAGIAVGIMGLGYLSGNHSPAPAATMAQDASGYESQQVSNGDMYNASVMPTLSDSNLNVKRGGANQGYVININAQTSGGQQAAQQAIAGAVSTLTPQNSSVNISMNTSVSDKINQLQLQRMVARSMGLQY